MSDNNAPTNRIREYFTLSFCLTAVSQSSYILYFGHFGIQPLQYFEPSEIVVNSIKDFVLISIVYYIYIFIAFLGLIIIDFIKNRVYVGVDGLELVVVKKFESKKSINIKKHSVFKAIFFSSSRRSNLSWLVIVIFAVSAISYIGMYLFARNQIKGLFNFMVLINIINLLFIVIMSVNHWKKKYEKVIQLDDFYKSLLSLVSPMIFLTVLVYSMLIFFFSAAKAKSAVRDNNYIGTKFYMQTDTITIDKTNLLVGRSKEWVFIYMPKLKATKVIRRSDLKSELIRNRNRSLFGVLFQNY